MKTKTQALATDLFNQMDAYWHLAHIKPRLLGHRGTTLGLNFIYVHLNLNVINITGPGHGEPGFVANAYLEGTYSEMYPNFSQDEDGLPSSRASGVY